MGALCPPPPPPQEEEDSIIKIGKGNGDSNGFSACSEAEIRRALEGGTQISSNVSREVKNKGPAEELAERGGGGPEGVQATTAEEKRKGDQKDGKVSETEERDKEEDKEEDEKEDVKCYEKVSDYVDLLKWADFWLQGVAMLVVGALGLVGNGLTLYILPRMETHHNFHKLLMSLAAVDSLVIVFFVTDLSLVGQFLEREPAVYRVTYPYLMHPLRNMVLTASIYMVAAISAERYKAICHPLVFRPSHLSYLAVVLATTVCLELPRFLEFSLTERPDGTLTYWPTK